MLSNNANPNEVYAEELQVGKKTDKFCSRDNKYYPPTITKITDTHVDVAYDDGQH